MLVIYIAITKNNIIIPFINTLFCLLAKFRQRIAQTNFTFSTFKSYWQFHCVETFVTNIAKYIQLRICQYRMWQTHHLAVTLVGVEYTSSYATYILCKRHNEILTY